MTTDNDESTAQAVFDALADPDCRQILSDLDTYRTADEIADRCELARTSTYRKLELLSETGLVDERLDVRSDGHHTTMYKRDISTLVVNYDEESFDVNLFNEAETADSRLAKFWTHISEEL